MSAVFQFGLNIAGSGVTLVSDAIDLEITDDSEALDIDFEDVASDTIDITFSDDDALDISFSDDDDTLDIDIEETEDPIEIS